MEDFAGEVGGGWLGEVSFCFIFLMIFLIIIAEHGRVHF
jgi:hypothetical protein